jgi:hypothetical protein
MTNEEGRDSNVSSIEINLTINWNKPHNELKLPKENII